MPAKKPTPKPITLNEEQQAVVSAREGFYQVVAGPGSGKSYCLVSRFSELIKEEISADDILSLSFTKTAAKNLRDRVESQVGALTTTRTAGAVTFHSLALSFAIEERNDYPFTLAEFPLASDPVAGKIAADVARKHEIDSRVLRAAISLWRCRRVSPAAAVRDSENKLDAKQLKLALGYKAYCKKCESEGLLDFDSLIYWAVEILAKKPATREKWVRNFLQIDEAQDLSKIEWDLVKLISGKSVMAVGDISQGIYSFRGSDPQLFASMDNLFPGTQTLFLATNYRSTPEIVDFIRPIATSQELAEKFHTHNSSGPVPEVRGFNSSGEESLWVVSEIRTGVS